MRRLRGKSPNRRRRGPRFLHPKVGGGCARCCDASALPDARGPRGGRGLGNWIWERPRQKRSSKPSHRWRERDPGVPLSKPCDRRLNRLPGPRADFPLSGFSDFIFEAELVARSIGDYFSGAPLRLGVTGLSRAGKTVFLTALVNNLIAGARLPVLSRSPRAASFGRSLSRNPTMRCRGLLMRASEEPRGTRSPLARVQPVASRS